MPTCPSCSAKLPALERFCPRCGASLPSSPSASGPSLSQDSDDLTIDSPSAQPSEFSEPAVSGDSELLTPGQILSNRYRIVSFIGRGGMGVVYRADDMKLGQAVALKFLPAKLANQESWLQRLYQEVRVAREVSHPNVCRVHDVGEVDGRHFLSMEYVEGEDLGSLLRRIGRLPHDKAVQIASQLCTGLAAAHAKNVIHRDLKPANIMLDNQGSVRITDFGLAVATDKNTGKPQFGGTPAYMAPEQLSQGDVSELTDIYSLGLVLYEIFTGEKTHSSSSIAELKQHHSQSSPRSPSSIIEALDPAVEATIMRCLEHDPTSRPPSALAVAAGLPGGDPLNAALAAGMTPSPELVAAAGKVGSLKPMVALACLVGVVVAVLVLFVVGEKARIVRLVPLDKPPAVLKERAREVRESLGYDEQPQDSATWFRLDSDLLEHIEETDQSPDRWQRLRSGSPSAIQFSQRTSPDHLFSIVPGSDVTTNYPPFVKPGMTKITLDSSGRLVHFAAVSSEAFPDERSTVEFDWSTLLAVAGLDSENLTESEPERIPPVFADRHRAWTGTYPENSEIEFRFEAAALDGQVVWARFFNPWDIPDATNSEDSAQRILVAIVVIIFILMVTGAILLARRNFRAGRGDRRGAMRLALIIFAIGMLGWVFGAHHVFSVEEIVLVVFGFTGATGTAALAWLFYAAIEPYARKYWPHTLISWNRLLAGRWKDPLIGRDILLGCLMASWLFVAFATVQVLPESPGAPPKLTEFQEIDSLIGIRHAVGQALSVTDDVTTSVAIFLILVLFRIVLRRHSLAIGATLLLFLVLTTEAFTAPLPSLIYGVLAAVVLVFTIVRLGLLAAIALNIASSWLWEYPATFDFSAWYAPIGLIGAILVCLSAYYGFHTSLAGKPLFKEEF
ncbi:MAG: protein kinase [bacterium]|nr:protein kinase [bacterium]